MREYLSEHTTLEIIEKPMFGMLNFMVDGKTCICVGSDRLMLRFDPENQEVKEHNGYEMMLMKGREYKGYCYMHPEGFASQSDFEFVVNLCLSYNPKAKASVKKKK